MFLCLFISCQAFRSLVPRRGSFAVTGLFRHCLVLWVIRYFNELMFTRTFDSLIKLMFTQSFDILKKLMFTYRIMVCSTVYSIFVSPATYHVLMTILFLRSQPPASDIV